MRALRVLSCVAIAIGIALGAFGAHGLRNSVPPQDLLIWEKGVLYHLLNALGAFIISVLSPTLTPASSTSRIGWLLLGSIVVFSGSLYLLVLTNQRWLGMITPLGGTGFIVGWLLLARALARS